MTRNCLSIAKVVARVLWILAALTCLLARDAVAQELRGRTVDAVAGSPVAFGEVVLLSDDGVPVAVAVADSAGRFALHAPVAGEYHVVVYRYGYEELRSLLMILEEGRVYEIEVEVQPLPVSLPGLEVSVVNEERTIQWLRRAWGGNPRAMKGFRLIQGARLEEAKSKSDDNTAMLRWLYIPVSHGRRVCVLSLFDKCGQLYVNGRRVPNEHIDSIDLNSIAVVVTTGLARGSVHLFTHDFDWMPW